VKVTAGRQGQTLRTPHLTNNWSNLDESYGEEPLASLDDLPDFLEVKGQGHSRPKYVVAKSSTSTLGVLKFIF